MPVIIKMGTKNAVVRLNAGKVKPSAPLVQYCIPTFTITSAKLAPAVHNHTCLYLTILHQTPDLAAFQKNLLCQRSCPYFRFSRPVSTWNNPDITLRKTPAGLIFLKSV